MCYAVECEVGTNFMVQSLCYIRFHTLHVTYRWRFTYQTYTKSTCTTQIRVLHLFRIT